MKVFKNKETCEACGSKDLEDHIICQNPINIKNLSSDNFKVTSKEYSSCVETIMCNECGLVQTKFDLEFSDIVKFYSGVTDEEYLKSSKIRGISNYSQVMKIIKKFKPDAKSVFEIGAGSGTTLHLLQEDFKVLEGLEPSSSFCTFAKKEYNIKLHQMGYEDFKVTKKFDVVMALDVIEHVVSPKQFMIKVKELLAPGGIAIIGTPNIESVSHKLLKKKWYHIRPPHIYYFSQRSFNVMAKKNGLKVIKEKFFKWTLPTYYLFDAFQKLLFKKSFINMSFLKFKIPVNLFDSKIYILEKSE